MVEKIDRPEAPPSYRINPPKDAKEDQHSSPGEREEQEERYQERQEKGEWAKFGGRRTTIRPFRVARSKIARCLFRGVSLKGGVAILSVDVAWRDGRKTSGALILVKQLGDFVRLKRLGVGQEVPEEFWGAGKEVEIGIVQEVSDSLPDIVGGIAKAPAGMGRRPARWMTSLGLVGPGGGLNWGILALYIFLLAIAAFVAAVEIGR